MRVVFLGTPEFAVPSLDALVAQGIRSLPCSRSPIGPRGAVSNSLNRP